MANRSFRFGIAILLLLMLVGAVVASLWFAGGAMLVAVVVPVILISRFRVFGFVGSVFFGWGIVHVANITTSDPGRVDAVFTGVWAVLGPIFMLVYCIPILLGRYGIDALLHYRQRHASPRRPTGHGRNVESPSP